MLLPLSHYLWGIDSKSGNRYIFYTALEKYEGTILDLDKRISKSTQTGYHYRRSGSYR
jgi:hypothetical protein